MGCAGMLGRVYLCKQRWGRAPEGELEPFCHLGLSGARLTPHPASLPLQIYHGKIKSKASEPFLVGRNPRVEFVGSTTGKDNNISIVLKNVEFSDAGKYTCHVRNPKEKNAQHNATIFLTVVQKSKCQPGVPCPTSGTGAVGMQSRADPTLTQGCGSARGLLASWR